MSSVYTSSNKNVILFHKEEVHIRDISQAHPLSDTWDNEQFSSTTIEMNRKNLFPNLSNQIISKTAKKWQIN